MKGRCSSTKLLWGLRSARTDRQHILGRRCFWSGVPQAPPDAILGLTAAFKADPHPLKVNLGVGAYRTDEGQPLVLESVRRAEAAVLGERLDHEYADIGGNKDFLAGALAFALGEDAEPLQSGRVAAVQTLSGTGACRVAAEFLAKFGSQKTGSRAIYLPTPTWGNHPAIMRAGGLTPLQYRYYDPVSRRFDFPGLLEDVGAAPSGSVFLLHSCAHNPTGFDPSPAQWDELSAAMAARRHLAFFDNAYQGFASGDAERDAYSIRRFVRDGHPVLLAQSFAKNFGLYGDRVGALSVVCGDAAEAGRVVSQLKLVVRPMYSSPPLHGARIVSQVLASPPLRALWSDECAAMAARIQRMRVALRQRLEAGTSGGEGGGGEGGGVGWSHVTTQIGMFCYTGLSREQVGQLRRDHHIYCIDDGRISVAGLNSGNVDHVAAAILQVITR